MKKLCVLDIGHTKKKPGAKNIKSGLTEFEFNNDLAIRIEKKVKKAKIQRIYRKTYIGLPGQINALNPDFIIFLHCNAFNCTASGTEVLYWHKSTKGKKIAEILNRNLVSYLRLADRGIKPIDSDDRGSLILRKTKAPAAISEPFFIDNDIDLDRALEDLDSFAQVYANAIEEIVDQIVDKLN
jgi:N-acetylmuramoyl-L-alanine amidase